MPSDTHELADFLQRETRPYLDSRRSVGLSAGAVEGKTEYLAFGGSVSMDCPASPEENTLFEIGSITKVFTAILLAEMHLAGEASLNDRVNRRLPPHGRLRCGGGDEVTLLHLATHTSGLPRLPVNLTWAKLLSANPYADYTVDDLYAGLARCRLRSRPGARTSYSNLGSGLLGHILSLITGVDYERLLMERVLQPLSMRDTAIRLSEEQHRRMAPGHSAGKAVPNWDFQALAGAGAIRSSISDMMRFLHANLDPPSTPLGKAIEFAQQMQTRFEWKWHRDLGCLGPLILGGVGGLLAWRSFGLPLWSRFLIPLAAPAAIYPLWHFGGIGSLDDMALGWHFDRLGQDSADLSRCALWHNGGTGGYASYMAFSRSERVGVVLLANSDLQPDRTGRRLLIKLLQKHAAKAPSTSA